MKKIVLVSCVSKKRAHPAKAEAIYVSPLFLGSLRHAKGLKPDRIFILSAKYGLLDLGAEIAPYDTTLKKMSSAEVKAWAEGILEQLRTVADLQKDHFIFLAGEKYRKYLLPHLASYEIPLQGLGIGKQLQYYAAAKAQESIP